MNKNSRVTRGLLAVLVLLLGLALMGFTTLDSEEHHHVLIAKLSGAGTGDPDGKGKAKITLTMDESGNHMLCWDIKVKDITLPATAAHIHSGVEGTTGPVVVPLSAPDVSGHSSGCTAVTHELAMSLHMNPEQYYVNVHNVDYPGGALRGQLFLAEE